MNSGGREMGVRLGRWVIGTLNRLTPKQHKAVLAGYPDVEDGILEIARQLIAQGDVKVVVLTHEEVPQSVRDRMQIVWRRKRSLSGVYHYLTARFVFFTHGLYLSPRPPRSQTCINVWHGMPFKRIGHLIGKTPPSSTFVIATSDMFLEIVAKSFRVPASKVLTTGLPRNDVLVRAARRSQEIKAAMGIAGNIRPTRLITWLPTYRQAVRGVIRTDGIAHPSIFGMDDIDIAEFGRFLEANDCICIIKPHPMAADYAMFTHNDRVRLISDQSLLNSGMTLYELVGASDMLITDASSVFVDFVLLNKPIVIAFPDFDEYRRSRGFSVDPIESFLAGPLVSTFPELKIAISEAFLTDPYEATRTRIASLFHKYMDDGATKRLLEMMALTERGSPSAVGPQASKPEQIVHRRSNIHAAGATVRRIQ